MVNDAGVDVGRPSTWNSAVLPASGVVVHAAGGRPGPPGAMSRRRWASAVLAVLALAPGVAAAQCLELPAGADEAWLGLRAELGEPRPDLGAVLAVNGAGLLGAEWGVSPGCSGGGDGDRRLRDLGEGLGPPGRGGRAGLSLPGGSAVGAGLSGGVLFRPGPGPDALGYLDLSVALVRSPG